MFFSNVKPSKTIFQNFFSISFSIFFQMIFFPLVHDFFFFSNCFQKIFLCVELSKYLFIFFNLFLKLSTLFCETVMCFFICFRIFSETVNFEGFFLLMWNWVNLLFTNDLWFFFYMWKRVNSFHFFSDFCIETETESFLFFRFFLPCVKLSKYFIYLWAVVFFLICETKKTYSCAKLNNFFLI